MKKKHNLAFHLLMLLLIVVVTILVFYKALVHLRNQIDEIKINSAYRVRQIIEDFDLLLINNEEIIGNRLNENFPELKLLTDKKNISSFPLNKIAHQNEIDFILISDIKGNVLASTDMKLKGESLPELMPSFDDVLNKIKGKTELNIERIGILPFNESIYKSAWYADLSNDRVLIYAIDMKKFLTQNSSESFANYLFGGYFDNMETSIQLVSEIDFGIYQNGNIYYFSGDKVSYKPEEHIQTATSIEGQILNNYKQVILPVNLTNSLGSCRFLAKISFDNDTIRLISLNLLFRAVLGFAILALVIYLIIYFFFKTLQRDRQDLLIPILKSIREKKFVPQSLDDKIFNPEIENELKILAEEFTKEPEDKSDQLILQQNKNKVLQEKLADINKQLQVLQTKLEESQEKRREESETVQRTDKVTGLPNHITLMEYLDYESGRTDREKSNFSIMIVKLNNLEKLTKLHNPRFVDYILNKIGAKLRSSLRRQDRIGRWKIDEFMLVLPVTNADGTKKLIVKLIDMLNNLELYRADKKVNIELLFGASIYLPGNKIDDCIRKVNVAIQEAEHTGQSVVLE